MSRVVLPIGGVVTAVLVAFASGYGYHRDELYFLAAGEHLDWGFADQGPLTPLIARAMSEITPDSLTVLRLPSAVAAGLTVLLTGLLARELGGNRRAQAIAGGCAAVSVIVLFTGHLLSTSTFDLLVWTALTWLAVRAIRTRDDRLWFIAGVVLGIGLLNKPLPAFLALGMLAGVAIAGPRRLLANPYVWSGAAIALVLWSPWLVWQADHGWPQIDVSREIAAGGSTSSEAWWAIVPFQALLVGPLLAPIWVAGLVRLFRDRGLRDVRFLAWAWVLLAIVFMATAGKPYYLAGFLPVLLGAGAIAADGWLDRGRAALRRVAIVAAIAISGVTGVI
ncbi:MAG: glycosyltransferase family 39 protein, partial [Solirubrobacterales bacterium]